MPEGDYPFVVKNAKPSHSVKDPETETIELELSIDSGSGRVWDTLTFSEKAAFKIDEFRESIGETVTPGETVDIEPDELVGASGRAHIYVDSYNGKEKNKVKEYLAPLVKPLPKRAAVATEDTEPDNEPF
jgi:hypothetical protein